MFVQPALCPVDFSQVPKPSRKAVYVQTSTSTTMQAVEKRRDSNAVPRQAHREDKEKKFFKWFHRRFSGNHVPQPGDRDYFDQARAYDVVEPLMPLLVAEKRPKLYPDPYRNSERPNE
ncbi:hypothetical protein AC578_7579 [Pseudocercospora eumusae]|uniref:Uncharacterized protein n=1 Tax=Pseudocercospora eumusae TaxID=321146 RepID=A0A139HRJ7_9PEZI|nr:hypothetical protein AC578_7579 [Pseudocercospora eumusae]